MNIHGLPRAASLGDWFSTGSSTGQAASTQEVKPALEPFYNSASWSEDLLLKTMLFESLGAKKKGSSLDLVFRLKHSLKNITSGNLERDVLIPVLILTCRDTWGMVHLLLETPHPHLSNGRADGWFWVPFWAENRFCLKRRGGVGTRFLCGSRHSALAGRWMNLPARCLTLVVSVLRHQPRNGARGNTRVFLKNDSYQWVLSYGRLLFPDAWAVCAPVM